MVWDGNLVHFLCGLQVQFTLDLTRDHIHSEIQRLNISFGLNEMMDPFCGMERSYGPIRCFMRSMFCSGTEILVYCFIHHYQQKRQVTSRQLFWLGFFRENTETGQHPPLSIEEENELFIQSSGEEIKTDDLHVSRPNISA
ncbi:hypothetical protein YC2023_114447 [Brassica napus]